MTRSLLSACMSTLVVCMILAGTPVECAFDEHLESASLEGFDHERGKGDADHMRTFDDQSPQETPDECVTARPLRSTRNQDGPDASVSASAPSTLLVSQLFHPPTSMR